MVNIFKLSGPVLLFTPIMITIAVGLFFNNFASNGFQTPATAQFAGCPTVIQWNDPNGINDEICQAFNQTYTAPCQSSSASTYCGFHDPSVLNPNSPFTCVLTLSLSCIINNVNVVQAPQPFAFFTSNLNIFAICLNVNGTGPQDVNIDTDNFLLQCDQDFVNSTEVPYSSSYAFVNSSSVSLEPNYNCTNYVDASTPYSFTNYAYWGCVFQPAHSSLGSVIPVSPANKNTTYGFILAVNGSQAQTWLNAVILGGGPNAVDVQGSILVLEQTADAVNARQCITDALLSDIPPECQAWIQAVIQTNTQTQDALFSLGASMSFIAGIILTIVGLGVGIGAGGLTFNFSLTPNSQGTRFAQIAGFSLLLIAPLDSEFGGPYSALSVFGIGAIVLTIFAIMEVGGIFLMVAQPAVSQ